MLILQLILDQAITSFINQALKGVTKDYGVELLDKYQNITKQDILGTLKKYFLPLFDPLSSVAIVVTAPSKAEEIGTGLQTLGFEVTQRELAADSADMDGVEGGSDSESDGSSRE
jgi:Zn-dependent M16 (insulinase) family peptidase